MNTNILFLFGFWLYMQRKILYFHFRDYENQNNFTALHFIIDDVRLFRSNSDENFIGFGVAGQRNRAAR